MEPGIAFDQPDEVVLCTLGTAELDLLAKILEPTPDDPPEGLELYRKIKAELADAKQDRTEVNAERP